MKLPLIAIILSTLMMLGLSLGISTPETRALETNQPSKILALANSRQSLNINPKISNPESFTAEDSKKNYQFLLAILILSVAIISVAIIYSFIKAKKAQKRIKDSKRSSP